MIVSQQSAASVLRRHKRFNSGHLEEVMRDNLERECIEEQCSWEEAREVFEDNEKTMEFWTGYIDGDQCESNPCQHGGTCNDGMSSYTCWCATGFGGKNCEIEIGRQCDVGNGGCMQFCHEDKSRGATCVCAPGYRRRADKMSCEPITQYSCGQIGKSIKGKLSQRSLFEDQEETQEDLVAVDSHDNGSANATGMILLPVGNDTNLITNDTIVMAPAALTDASATTTTTVPPEAVNITTNNTTTTVKPTSDGEIPSWHFFPTLPTIKAESNIDERIVGGNEATRGEIPWQVALINQATGLAFCGGSLLSDVWVITAAHCIEEGPKNIFVRLGEHNLQVDEKTEQDRQVDETILHPRYDAKKSKYNHDLALLHLAMPVTFSDHVIPICLGPKDFTEFLMRMPDATALVSGWGRVLHGGRDSATLRKVELPYVDRTECKGSSRDVTNFMFCAGYSSIKKDACQGDSGGPHASKYKGTWFLTGIVSWGEECAKEGKYGIYTRVSRYFHWISNVTGLTLERSGK